MTDVVASGHEQVVPPVASAMDASRQVAVSPSGHGLAAVPAFEAVYAQHVRFVWRTVRSFGVAEEKAKKPVPGVPGLPPPYRN